MCRLFISKWKRAVKENKQACFRETLSLYHRSQGSQGIACTFLIGLGQRRAAGEEPGFRVGELQNSAPLKKKKKITILPSEGNVRAVCTRWSFGELVAQCSVGPVCPKQQRGSSGATCLDINCSCCALEGLEAPRDETPRSPGQFVTVLSGPCSWKGLCIVWSEYLLLSLKQVMPCAICCKHREWFIALPAA